MNPSFTPLQLPSLLAWYRADQGVTQANCAKFVALSANYLSTTYCSWLEGLSKLTIALDVRPSDVTGRQGWVARWDSGKQFILRCQGGTNPGAIFFLVANTQEDPGANYVMTANDVLSAGLPTRVVVVFDSGKVMIYVNGAAVDTTPVGNIPGKLTIGSGAALRIGADLSDSKQSYFFDGLMSRVCMWAETALTANEVERDFNTWIGVDPGSGEPVSPTHAWRMDEEHGTRQDCVGDIDLSDINNNTESEAHVSQVNDLSGRGFHARIRPVNGPILLNNGLNRHSTIKHIAAGGQFLVCGLLSGKDKPSAWSFYALAMCNRTIAECTNCYPFLTGPSSLCTPAEPACITKLVRRQSSLGLFNNFAELGGDAQTWLVCVFGDKGGSGALPGSFGMGCGDDTFCNQANSPEATYSANTWFQLTGIFPGGTARVNTWFNGIPVAMTPLGTAQACACSGVAHPSVIGAASAEGKGVVGVGPSASPIRNNDFFDGQWADIVVCGADTTSQRSMAEAYQMKWCRE